MTDIEAIAMKWKGTPFVPHAAQPGAGVDCVHLCAEILQEAGLIGDYSFPTYRCDSGSHRAESTVLRWLESQVGFLQVPVGAHPEPGDVLCFRVGRTAHHVGLALGRQRFIHALRGKGVLVSTLRDPTYAKRFVAAYRPVQP